jgi:hypothetical protein
VSLSSSSSRSFTAFFSAFLNAVFALCTFFTFSFGFAAFFVDCSFSALFFVFLNALFAFTFSLAVGVVAAVAVVVVVCMVAAVVAAATAVGAPGYSPL